MWCWQRMTKRGPDMAGRGEGSSKASQSKSIVLLFLALSFLYEMSSATSVFGHSLSKRSFFDIKCRGVYEKSMYATLDRVCQDCYNLYREPELHTLCRYLSNDFFTLGLKKVKCYSWITM
jgi:hypothetical protein